MDITGTKITTLVLLTFGSITIGFLPLIVKKQLERKQMESSKIRSVLSLIMCLGGGILLSTCFLHMLPEAREQFVAVCSHQEHDHDPNSTEDEDHDESDDLPAMCDTHFPYAELTLGLGCLMIYLVEEIASLILKGTKGREKKTEKIMEGMSARRGSDFYRNEDDAEAAHSHFPLPDEDGQPLSSWRASLRNLVVTIAVSLHALFEGLAIGLEKDTTNVWIVFVAIAAHKYMIALSLGTEMVSVGTRVSIMALYLTLFSIFSPVGVGLGILIEETGPDPLTLGVLQGLTAGTLLYVAVFEILQKEKENSRGRPGLLKFFFVGLGYAALAVVQALSDRVHEH